MPIVAVFQFPDFTQAIYEKAVATVSGKSRMESPGDWPVHGLLAHVAGQGTGGFRVVDVWESEEAFSKFGEHVVPLLQSMGVAGEPEVYPAHTYVSA